MLSIVIPAYNEEKRILPTLNNYYHIFSEKMEDKFEIIIVPNNCSDRTVKVCKKFSEKRPKIRIIEIKGYSGKGGAVFEGFRRAKGKCVGFTDADGSTDAENFFGIYKRIGKYDGIIGSRRKRGATVLDRTISERISSQVFNLVTRFLMGFKFKDTQCGAKIFTKKAAEIIIKNHKENGWIFDVDILKICKKHNLKIIEIPVKWINKRGTKLGFRDKIVSVRQLITYGIKNK